MSLDDNDLFFLHTGTGSRVVWPAGSRPGCHTRLVNPVLGLVESQILRCDERTSAQVVQVEAVADLRYLLITTGAVLVFRTPLPLGAVTLIPTRWLPGVAV